MTPEEFYGDWYAKLTAAENQMLQMVNHLQEVEAGEDGRHSILYSSSRIKSPASMTAKLQSKGLPVNQTAAIYEVNDAVGVRIVCAFADDVYRVASSVSGHTDYEVLEEKDYIRQPKPNGYRSLHLILRTLNGPGAGITVELQMRTIAEDFWAALEHQMKYKHEVKHEELVRSELKRCADEIASVDLSMQTLRDLIAGS